ncbi:MAG TPA: hypothetical protein VME17_05750 [Bryobacteraceae bacterium]|nr:hypothetical protein [Bryobacteraceae bacterium]
MATRKKAEPKEAKPPKAKPEKQSGEGEVLEKAAKAIGSALGAIAVKTGIAHADAPPKKSGKLVKKDKKRLPRKEKKRAKKKLLQ